MDLGGDLLAAIRHLLQVGGGLELRLLTPHTRSPTRDRSQPARFLDRALEQLPGLAGQLEDFLLGLARAAGSCE